MAGEGGGGGRGLSNIKYLDLCVRDLKMDN